MTIIPNEIYISIFEYIAPPTGRLPPEELEIFANLSRVCRFFANFCLPRIFEFVEFSGTISCNDTPARLRKGTIYKAPREATLCTQIAAKQPLALSLAKRVRVCDFTNWKLDSDVAGSWAVRLFVKKYIAGMSHMKNIRELKFSASFVDAEHWSVIATLESLEELSFESCRFLQDLADVEPETRVKVKVSRLRVVKCWGTLGQSIAAIIDPQYLRTLVVDCTFYFQVGWLPQSALTELHSLWQPDFITSLDYLWRVHITLMQAPQSIEALWLSVDIRSEVAQGTVRSIFKDPAIWQNLPLLRSLTLQAFCQHSDKPANVSWPSSFGVSHGWLTCS